MASAKQHHEEVDKRRYWLSNDLAERGLRVRYKASEERCSERQATLRRRVCNRRLGTSGWLVVRRLMCKRISGGEIRGGGRIMRPEGSGRGEVRCS